MPYQVKNVLITYCEVEGKNFSILMHSIFRKKKKRAEKSPIIRSQTN